MTAISGRAAFGAFELDLESGTLRRSGRALKLRPQPMRVLCLLVSQAGKPVDRAEIRRLLWGDSTFVNYDAGVDYCVYRIRSVLGDNADAPRYVETLPGRGYRFIAPVTRERWLAEPSIAVLPFANLNGDPREDYFADGVTDALITELARIPVVRVISRRDCEMSAVLATQRDVARAIAGRVAATLTPGGAVIPSRPAGPAVAPGITEAYLNARTEFEKMSAEGIGKALRYFRQMTLEAPDFAPGLAWHAACLFLRGYWGHAPISEVYPAAKHLALQALAIDDTLAPAHLVLAWMNLLLDWDLDAAMREVRRAIELSPSDTDAHSFYSTLLCFVGQKSEAMREVEYMLKLNPAPLLPNQYAAWMFLHLGEYTRAEAQARRTIDRFPDSLQPYFVLGWCAWYRGRAEEAVVGFEKALGHSREALSLCYLGHVYARLGRVEEARRLLLELEQLRGQGQAPPTAFAVMHAGLGDIDTAFEWLETAYRLRDGYLFWLPGAPGLDPLHSDPRFAGLVHRVGGVGAVAPARAAAPRAGMVHK